MRAVLRRARGKGGSLVRPFVPLELELRGRGELKNVGRMDSAGIAAWLHGDALFSGLYLNELLMRLLPAEAPFVALFEHYALTLQALAEGARWSRCCVRSNGGCSMSLVTRFP